MKKYKLGDIIYINKKNFKQKYILPSSKKKKLIIIVSEKSSLNLRKKCVLNLYSDSVTIKKNLAKLKDFQVPRNLSIIEKNKVKKLGDLDFIINEGVLFNNKKILNPKEIKIDYIKKLISSKQGKLFVLYNNNKIIGYLFVIFRDKVINFYEIYISDKVNKFFIIFLLNFFFNKYCLSNFKIFTNIHYNNIKSKNFFKSLGFKIKNKKYYQIVAT